MLLEIWDTFFILMSKYIHIHNPKLPLYIEKKYSEFRDIIGRDDTIQNVRNNKKIRIIFCSITTVLSCSDKLTILDHLQNKFLFKIESLYENLKAPNTSFVDLVYKPGDPVEYLIPFNEFVYHLTVSKQKVDIIYWLNWIIEYDILCRKKKKIIGCVSRSLYENKKKLLETNIIWIVWDSLFAVMNKERCSQNLKNIVESIYSLFTVRYCVSTNKKRISLICHTIELLVLHKELKYDIAILKNNDEMTNLEENINVVMEQIKKHEVKSVKNETSIKDTKMDIYHNIYMNL